MDNILRRIAATKRQEVEAMKRLLPMGYYAESAGYNARPILPMSNALRGEGASIIAEHKRRSPSKGEIAPASDVSAVAMRYAAEGASAMSVLTDTAYFGGSPTDLAVARKAAPGLPLLRKDFIVDAYQIYQALALGADAVLLIAALLNDREMRCLNDVAHDLGLQTLVEVHDEAEARRVPADADMVGVNNRDLTDFRVDTGRSAALAAFLPAGCVRVAESGICGVEDVRRLRDAGFDAFLVGEAVMREPRLLSELAAVK